MSAAEVLAQHQGQLGITATGQWMCACKWLSVAPNDGGEQGEIQWRQHFLDALKAAGYAVVELPKPETDADGQLWFGEYDIRVDSTGAFTDYGDIFTDFGLGSEVLQQLSPAGARNWGLAFLAAADAAEADE